MIDGALEVGAILGRDQVLQDVARMLQTVHDENRPHHFALGDGLLVFLAHAPLRKPRQDIEENCGVALEMNDRVPLGGVHRAGVYHKKKERELNARSSPRS